MNYKIGESQEVSKTISETDVYLFAGISGDFNPVHVNRVEAEGSLFGKQIAHGILVGGLLSNVIGMKLPGPGTIYMEQDMKFLKPVYIGDTVSARVEITEVLNREKHVLRLRTQIKNQNGDIVIDGFAIVKAPMRGDDC
jgi:3-hydroxybutyryl-CoA dehydratase|nr:MaoC family dehydratase [uncultured Acetatifactor sp.]